MLDIFILMMLPVIAYVGIVMLVDYLLKKKLKPNQKYLNELDNLKISNFIRLIMSIIVFIALIQKDGNSRIIFIYLTLFLSLQIIDIKIKLNYLRTKHENENTKKYLNVLMGVYIGLIIVNIGYILLF